MWGRMQAWRYGAFSIRRAPVLIVLTVVLAISLLGAVCADDIEITEGSKIEVLEIVGNKVTVKPL